jgi:hypothetical protein
METVIAILVATFCVSFLVSLLFSEDGAGIFLVAWLILFIQLSLFGLGLFTAIHFIALYW